MIDGCGWVSGLERQGMWESSLSVVRLSLFESSPPRDHRCSRALAVCPSVLQGAPSHSPWLLWPPYLMTVWGHHILLSARKHPAARNETQRWMTDTGTQNGSRVHCAPSRLILTYCLEQRGWEKSNRGGFCVFFVLSQKPYGRVFCILLPRFLDCNPNPWSKCQCEDNPNTHTYRCSTLHPRSLCLSLLVVLRDLYPF